MKRTREKKTVKAQPLDYICTHCENAELNFYSSRDIERHTQNCKKNKQSMPRIISVSEMACLNAQNVQTNVIGSERLLTTTIGAI